MDHDPPHTLFTLSEDNTHSSAANSEELGEPPPGLLRRITRFARRTPSTPLTMNPTENTFVPNARMPPKRKATSSARAGKSVHPASRSDSTTPASTEGPIIRSEDLFGKDSLIRHIDAFDGMADEDTEFDTFEMDVQEFRPHPNNNMQPTRERMQEALALLRTQARDKVKKTPDSIQSSSAILFTSDKAPGVSVPADDLDRIRYLPLRPAAASSSRDSISNDTNLIILPSHRQRIDRTAKERASSRVHWRENLLPVELFELIITHLSRDDIKSMRLVSKEFEAKVSAMLFSTSVVLFNTELYDMIDEDRKAVRRESRSTILYDGKGKGRARDVPEPTSGLHWQNAKQDAEGKVYKGHGLRVFQGFGRHIKKFGMSFEVAEGQLAHPPIKRGLDHVQAYHGSYDWPPFQYTRFENLAGLERTADETQRMKSAFSNLKSVKEVALSIDSGLGWLNGSDRSMKAQIFQRPSPVFGQSRSTEDRRMQDARDFWAAIQACHRSIGVSHNPKEVSLARRFFYNTPMEVPGLQGTRYADSRLWPTIAAGNVNPAVTNTTSEGPLHGVLYTTLTQPEAALQPLSDRSALVPSELRKEQKEWLMETEWAQRAFLECYMLAIMDNPSQFHCVKTLNIAKLSSGFIPLLARESFWDALPGLTDVTIHVKPDWRVVEKDNAGFAEAHAQNPSEAVSMFHRHLLRDRICLRSTIKKLNLGWASGGEHADGIFARNANILPAPITQLQHSTAATANFGLVFKYVEHLTLYNCWITPPTLTELVRNHANKALKTLTLDSVSLTAHPRFPVGGQAAAPLPPHIAQMLLGGGGNGTMNIQQLLNPQQGNAPAQGQQVQVPAPPPGQAPIPAQFIANLLGAQPNAQQPLQVHGAQGLNPQQLAQQHLLQVIQQHHAGLGANHPPIPAVAGVAQVFQAGAAQHLAQNNVFGNPAVAPAPSHWTAGHREGSWPELLDQISPGPVFDDYLPQPAPWETQRPERPESELQVIELKSCGYAKLNNTTFDQFAIEASHDHHFSNWFRARQMALSSAMMSASSDRYLARIVQYMPQRELDALLFGWGLTFGWNDPEKAEEAEYDGYLPGGSGRVSGRVWRGMGLVGQTVSAST